MLTMATEHANTKYARRLAKLIDWKGWDATRFCAHTGLDPSYVSKVLSGDLGKSRELSKLHERVLETMQIAGHYWTAPDDVAPEKALLSSSQQGDDRMAKARGDVAHALAKLAAERGEDGDMVKDLIMTRAPGDADAAWWTRRYVELADLYAAKRKPSND